MNAAFIVGAQEQVIINHSTLTNAERLIIALKVGETVTRPPAIYGHLYANGGIISGFVEPLSNVMIYRGDGSELNKLNIAGDRFSLNFQGENVFHENEQITIVAQMPGQPPSPVQIMKVEGNQGQTQTPVLKQPITSSSKKLYVEAEPYSQITIKVEGSQTEVMGSLWGPSGYVDISSLHLNAGSTLQVTARTFGKIISQVSSMKVLEPAGKTNKPLWNTAAAKQIYANGGLLPLRVEPYSALTLKKSDGTILASLNTDLYGYVSGSGIAFNFDSSNGFVEIMLKGPFEVSDYIEAISEVEGHLPSDSLQIPVQPISGTTEAPAGRMTQGIPGWLIRGTAEPNALLTVTRVSNGEVVGGTDYAKSSGDYGVYLNPEISVQPGERFRVTAEAPGKAVSLPVVVTAAEEDLELSNKPVITGNIYTNGAVLKVKAEPNAEVRAIYNGNTIAGSFTDMNGDGILRIYYLGGKAEDTVTITSKAYGKQQSVPVAKAIMPITDEISQLTCETCVVKDHADGMLRGTADPYATLLITDDYGVVKIEQTMYQSSDGSFELRVWPQSLNYRTGSQLWLIARSPGKLLSQRIPLTIAAASTTAKPTFSELKIYENGGYIGGTTEADAWVYVKDRFGRQLGSTSVYDAGNVKFKFKLDRRDLPLTAGDTVYITAQAPGKKESEPVIAEVLPIYGTTSVPTLKNDVYDYVPYILEGTADPYTFVDFFYKGVKVAGAISDGTGNYAVTFGSDVQFAGGEFLQMKGETIGKAPSERVQLPILAAPKTETPVVTGTVYGNGISLTVTMQTNGYYFVNIKTVDNTNIYQSEFFLKDTISFLRLDPPYISGKLTVTVQKAGMKKSDPVYVDVLPLQGKTEQPSATGTVKSSMDSNIIVNVQSSDTYIIVRDSKRKLISTQFSWGTTSMVQLSKYMQLKAGDNITISAVQLGKEESDPVTLQVQESEKTAIPSYDKSYAYSHNGWIEGKLPPNTHMNITVKRQLTGETLNSYFSWNSFHLDISRNVTLVAGEKLSVVFEEENKAESDPDEVTVVPLTGKTSKPTFTAVGKVLNEGYNSIQVSAEPNSYLYLARPNGELIDSDRFTSNGSYTFYFSGTSLKAGDKLQLTAEARGKNVSEPVEILVEDAGKTQTPTVTAHVYENGGWISIPGKANTFIFYEICKEDGMVITTYYGYGLNPLDIIINGSFLAGEQLRVTAKEDNLHKSDAVSVTVLSVQGKTDQPTVTGTVYDFKNSFLSGVTEPYTKVQLNRTTDNKTIAYTMASADGMYSMNIWTSDTKLTAGEQLSLTSKSFGKTASDPFIITVAAMKKTNAPTIVTAAVYEDGGWLSGTTDENVWEGVLVTKSDGTYLGSTSSNGSFKIDLGNQKLVAGEILKVTAVNQNVTLPSNPVYVQVQTISGKTLKPTVSGAYSYPSGGRLEGTAEPGAQIRVGYGDDTTMTTAVRADSNGQYSVSVSVYPYPEQSVQQIWVTADVTGKSESDKVYVEVTTAP